MGPVDSVERVSGKTLGDEQKLGEWTDYDPGWLVRLAREQHPDKPWLADGLSRCTRGLWESRAYVYFVDPSRFDEPVHDEQLRQNVLLDTRKGQVVLDPLDGGVVGGAEFLWLA